MPPRKRASTAKKLRSESVKSPRAPGGTPHRNRVQLQAWSSRSSTQGGHLDHYAEFVNMPVGIVMGFLVPAALCADWRMMTKDQRLMTLVLFAATMISAFFTFIFSASSIQAIASRAVSSSSTSSSFSTTVGAQKHLRFLYLFMYLSFMLVLFLTCVHTPMLRRKVLYPKLIFSLAVSGKLFAFFPPTARVYNDWISSRPPSLDVLRLVAIAIVIFGFSSSLKKGSVREITIAATDSYGKLEKYIKKLTTSEMRKLIGKR